MAGPEPPLPDADGDLYDSYLDGALAGAPEDPAAFLSRHAGASLEVRARIEALHRLTLARTTPGRATAERRVAEPGLPHERLGEFRLLRRIGAGGMGLVYEAEQRSLGRLVAVKVLRPDLGASPEARERFRREAQAVARLRHPGIVSVLAAGEEGEVRWIALDLVPGRGLDEVIREAGPEGALSPARAARWAARIARALEYAHSRGIVHRDVKPANLRIGPGDEPFLLDFGVAREEGGATLTGPFVGSVPWAAPEQLAGRPVDGRADCYGLGATLYQCLTGHAPFEGGTVDRAIHRALHEDPVPPGRLRTGVPRDLDAVVLKALEKDPAHRYAGAGAMAEDLEAVLEFRPVAARPPGPVRRLRAGARRHPALAAGAVTATVALAVLAGAAIAREAEAREAIRREAAEEVGFARARVAAFRAQRDAAEGFEREMAATRALLETQWIPPETDAQLDRKEEALHRLRVEREGAFHEVLDHLRRAERLDPSVEGAEEVRGRLYLEKWRDAVAAGDEEGSEFYRSLVAAHDPGQALSRANFGKSAVSFVADAPGAEVHLFRYREESETRPGGERRLVAVPRGAPPVPPGTFCLRVAGGAEGLRSGDLILEVDGHAAWGGAWVGRGGGGFERGDRITAVDGRPVDDPEEVEEALAGGGDGAASGKREVAFVRKGVPRTLGVADRESPGATVVDLRVLAEAGGLPARVLSGGAVRDALLPAGLLLRPTAAPVLVGEWSLAGRTPLSGVGLEPGEWLAVFRSPGREDQRVEFEVDAGRSAMVRATLAPEGSTPAGFVRLPLEDGSFVRFQDREVNCEEYLEFLNDPAVLSGLPPPGRPLVLVPRNRRTNLEGHWARGADGRYALERGWTPDWPVLGVSFEDAVAYAAWRTARDRPLGGRGVYGLPKLDEWIFAGGHFGRRWVWGNRMRPKWCKSCFSRRHALPEPGLRFPRDESPYGLLDMAGSVAEWLDDWYDRSQGTRRIEGGSWAWAKMDQFQTWGAQGWSPVTAGDETGFRLVLREAAR